MRRRVQRSLPDLAALMAADGRRQSARPGLAWAAEFGDPLGNLLRRAVEEARTGGRPLFSRENVAGVLVEVVNRYDLPPVKVFAAQIDQVLCTGVAGTELMEGLARTLIIAYKDLFVARGRGAGKPAGRADGVVLLSAVHVPDPGAAPVAGDQRLVRSCL